MSLETDTNKVDINLSHIDRETKNELEKEVKNLSILQIYSDSQFAIID